MRHEARGAVVAVVVAVVARGARAIVVTGPNPAFSGQGSYAGDSNLPPQDLRDTFNQCISNDPTGVNCGSAPTGVSVSNQDDRTIAPMNTWDVSGVESLKYLFASPSASGQSYTANTISFNADISSWNTNSVANMWGTFWGAENFNQNLANWNTQAVTDMDDMFHDAKDFNYDISGWNTAQVVFFSRMFNDATSFNADITGWSRASATSNGDTFQGATAWHSKYRRRSGESGNANDGPPNAWEWIPRAFTSRIELNKFVNLCLEANPTGACDCSSATVNCGPAASASIGNWNITGLTDLYGVFQNKWQFNQNINNWNTAAVTRMNWLFQNATAFNQPLNNWNVENVRDMYAMFWAAASFNQPLNSWNTNSVTATSYMFYGALAFNQPMNGWNTAAISDMGYMFYNAAAFNHPVNGWNTNSVTSMIGMFFSASAFNQPLEAWNTNSVTTMSYMFANAGVFDRPLNGWNTAAVSQMNYMFYNAAAFNHPVNGWNTNSVASMSYMFYNAGVFDQPLNGWNTAAVLDMNYMFAYTTFNQDISSWNVGSVTDMNYMFYFSTDFLQDGIRFWNVPAAANVVGMFYGATAWLTKYRLVDGAASPANGPPSNWYPPRPFLNRADLKAAVDSCLAASPSGACDCDSTIVDCGRALYVALTDWNTSLVTDMSDLFQDKADFNGDISGWNTAAVTDMSAMFDGARSFSIDISTIDTASVTNMAYMFRRASAFNRQLNDWNTAAVRNMSGMFENADSTVFPGTWNTASVQDMSFMFKGTSDAFTGEITDTNGVRKHIGNWDTSSVNDMNSMFYGAAAFNLADISSWNTASVTDMGTMFRSASGFNQDISGWDVSSVRNMADMFHNALAYNSPLFGGWDTRSVTSMARMFARTAYSDATASTTQTWNTASVKDFTSMFEGSGGFTAAISQWDTSSATTMEAMFKNASSFTSDLAWDTSSVTSMAYMFYGASGFSGSVNSWNVYNVRNMSGMFGRTIGFSDDLSAWNTMGLLDMTRMFEGAESFSSSLDFLNTDSVKDMSKLFHKASTFNGDIGQWNTASVTDMSSMFELASAFNKDVNGWNTAAVRDMSRMFANASAFGKAVGNWDVSAVTDMQSMFADAKVFNQDLSNWNTASVANMQSMFGRAGAFDNNGVVVLPWNTASVTDMSYMFHGTSSLRALNALEWQTSLVQTMDSMFREASSFNADVSTWDTQAVTSMAYMFQAAREFTSAGQSTIPWTTNNVVDMRFMFADATLFDGDITSWNTDAVTAMDSMFSNAISFKRDITAWTAATTSATNMFENATVWNRMYYNPDNRGTIDGPPNQFVQQCSNAVGQYASVDDLCVILGDCPFPKRCPEGNLGCSVGATGELCRACEEGYYKSGTLCLECPEHTAASAGIAAIFVVIAGLAGFKAAEALGAVSTNMIKKVVETLQFFNISFSVEIGWPLPVLNFADWLKAFNFSIEFLAPECAGANIRWPTLFWSSTLIIPLTVALLFFLRDKYVARRYNKIVDSIRGEKVGDTTSFWIARYNFLCGEYKSHVSETGDKVVKELQRQYKRRATLRTFGVLCMTVLYLPVCRVCLQAFDCLEYGSEGKFALVHDVDVDCDSTSHQITMAAACLVLAFIGIGLPFFVIQKVRRIRLDGKLDDARTLDSWGALYDIYRRVELTEVDRLEIAELSRNLSKINSRQPSLKRAKTLETVNAQKSLAKSASLRSAPSLERKPTFKIDEETEAVVRDVDERLNEEMSAVVKDEDETKNKKFLFSLKSNVFRTASMKARARGESMRWVDRLALYYLALEMVVKLGVILAGSAQIAGDISVYGLVTVHWFSALFVFICQPWRIITLGFGQRKVNNALNKTESSAGFLQGAIPLIGLLLATDSSLTGLSTGFLLTLIVCLLCVRVFFIVSERFAVKTEKWNFEKEPEETAMKVNRKFIELGVAGKIVGIYALKAQVAVQRRKVRARLEATREAMLSKIETMRTAEHADESQITALLGIANEMAVIVNACTVQPYPEGLDPQRQIDSAMDLLEKLLADADGELARRQGEPTANALYLLLRVHAYDRAIKQLDDDMLVYAQSECVNELVTLGQQVSLLRDEQATLREPFGTEELNRVTLQLHADVFTDTLAPRAESDDLEGVLAVLDTVHQIAVKHETWRDECVELLEHPEDHELIGGDIEITRIVVDGAVDDLKNHDVHISQLIEYCAMDWQQYFKNFGKKRYARTLREMTDVAVKAINAGDTSALETELSTRVEEFVAWCVSASEGIAHCGFGKRNLGIGRVAHDSLRAFVDKKSNKLQPLALKRARKLTKKPGFFKSLFGGGGQSASEEESNDVDSATEIDEFADERSQSDDDAPAPEPEPEPPSPDVPVADVDLDLDASTDA